MTKVMQISAEKTGVFVLWFLIALFTVFHSIDLPLLLTFDSTLYLDQAQMLGDPRFWTQWHFLRTPLLQLITRIGFELFGVGPRLLIFVNTAFGFGGIVILFFVFRRWFSPLAASLICVGLAVHPTLVTYQHTFLTEAGSFFFMTLTCLLFLRTVERNFSPRSLFRLGFSVAVAYYFRPTLFILSPLASIIVVSACWFVREAKKAFIAILLLLIVPFLLTVPWRMFASQHNWQADQIAFGLINQAVFDPDSSLLGSSAAPYRSALNASLVDGELPTTGISDHLIYGMIPGVTVEMADSSIGYFFRVVAENPLRYTQGVMRGLMLLIGIAGTESDNVPFQKIISTAKGHTVISGPPLLLAWAKDHFNGDYGARILAPYLSSSIEFYSALYPLGVMSTLLVVILIAVSGNVDLKLLGVFIICFGYLVYHALVLFSLDRMAVPVIPLFCAMVFVNLLTLTKLFRAALLDNVKNVFLIRKILKLKPLS
jgi:4-amino-4-deoxy-L-arabinose transferase-like glycosyltransferase